LKLLKILIPVLFATAVLGAQKPINPNPLLTGSKELCGDNIDNDGDGLIDEGCTSSGGGGGTNLPPPVQLTWGGHQLAFRGNEDTYQMPWPDWKAMAGKTINGLNVLVYAPQASLDQIPRAWLDDEHTIASYATDNNNFTPRLAELHYDVVDAQTVRGHLFDSRWNMDEELTYRVELPQPGTASAERGTVYVDLIARFTPHDVTLFSVEQYAVKFFASYQQTTDDSGFWFKGRTGPTATEDTWIHGFFNSGGITYSGSFLPVSGATLETHGPDGTSYPWPVGFRQQLYTIAWPRFADDAPYYCGKLTRHGLVYQAMFDSSAQTRFTIFKNKFLAGEPAWDWQWVLWHPVQDQTIERRMRIAVYPLNEATFFGDCSAEDAAWRATFPLQ